MCDDKYKVCLITYYGDNYGGCIQAYALQTIIQSMGYEVHIPMIHICGENNKRIYKILNILKNPVAYLKRRKYIKQHIGNDKLRSKAFTLFRDEFLNIDKSFVLGTNSQNADGYYAYVCGSDQIWNPFLYGVHPIWTLKFAPGGSKKLHMLPAWAYHQSQMNIFQDFRKI